uniref:Uncharacterized protein n=1 Tax=Neospora caninum (strain Liverpool) TaxID=572307 RepID=A0A0F7U623_NEOCL|nr:TPA: hypothetical protein BN1204_004320 [Neospora caninum Liverpool]
MAAEAVATSQSLVAPFDCGPGTGLTCSGNECPERQLSLTTDASGVEKATQSDFFDEESPGPPLPGSRATSTDSTGNEPGSRTESDAFSGDGGSPLPSGTQLPRPSFTNAKEFKANSPAAAVSVSEDEPPVTLSSTAPPSAPEAPAFRSLESCAESDVALAKDFGPEHAQKRQETEAAETEEPDEQGNRARAASRSSSRRPRDNWLNAQPLHIYTSPTDSSSRPTSLERTSSSAFTEKGARAARPRSRWTGDHAESPVTDFQKCGLAGLPPEVLKKSVLALRTQVEDYQKQLVEGSVQLMKAELKVKRLEESLKQREAGTRNAALPQTKGGEASQGENDATVLREENDRLKAELRIANSTADYLQKALRDRSNREIEMKNHIAALTAVNKDLQEQAKTLAALLSRDKTEASLRARRGEHTQAGISENGAMKLDRSPEIIPPIPCTQPTDGALRTKCLGDGDQALSRSQDDFDQSPRPAALLRRTSSSVMHWPSSAERASGKVQFDVCPVFGSVRYDPARTCPVDTALANFVNQRTNKIIFTRVRPGVYLYGRMPVRVQLGTEPETQTKRLEVVARGRRYSIANFINAFESLRLSTSRTKRPVDCCLWSSPTCPARRKCSPWRMRQLAPARPRLTSARTFPVHAAQKTQAGSGAPPRLRRTKTQASLRPGPGRPLATRNGLAACYRGQSRSRFQSHGMRTRAPTSSTEKSEAFSVRGRGIRSPRSAGKPRRRKPSAGKTVRRHGKPREGSGRRGCLGRPERRLVSATTPQVTAVRERRGARPGGWCRPREKADEAGACARPVGV